MAAQKKVVVRLSGGRVAWGYLPSSGFVREGQVELIEADARAKLFDLNEIEMIVYVKDFNLDDAVEPERLGRRAFAGRPRGEGLWVRLELREMASLEGLMSFGRGFLDEVVEDGGVFVTPPDARGNAVRVFVPRGSLRGMEVLGWVASPARKAAERVARETQQAELFGEE